MLNPLDYLTDAKKDKLIDAGLTKVADAAESAGAGHLAQALRNLRNDTPFIEDVAAGLQRALGAFSVEWGETDPELVNAIQNNSLWESTEILSYLSSILLRPAEIHGPEFERMKELLIRASPGTMEERVTAALEWLIDRARKELFTHPKLQGVHSLYLQAQTVDRQGEILEELRAIHRDNAAVLTVIAPQLSFGANLAISGSAAHAAPSLAAYRGEASDMPLPDVLTPPLLGSGLISVSYQPVIGKEAALWLEGIQVDITGSIEAADFEEQEKIAERLLGNDFGITSLTASGYYMLGESKRLQADFVSTEPGRERLLDAAADAYSTAADLDPTSARSQRGLGRVYEVRGEARQGIEAVCKGACECAKRVRRIWGSAKQRSRARGATFDAALRVLHVTSNTN